MIEKILLLGNISPIGFYGINNENIQLLKTHFKKLKIIPRGTEIKVQGDEKELALFEEKLNLLFSHYQKYNVLSVDELLQILKNGESNKVGVDADVILFGHNGKVIRPQTKNQKKMVDLSHKNDLMFVYGPAGSGKTYTAVALAVEALRSKKVKRIILCRPAVEAGENLGFLPGDLKEKIDPYLQPLYDALFDMIPPRRLAEYLEAEVIQIAPLAYMRGRTLSDAFVILDEAQNTTASQMRMFLTRMGKNAKMIVTGDITQIDLPRRQQSGLIQATQLLEKIKGIAHIQFEKGDIIRHRLVQQIVEAYEKYDLKEEQKTEKLQSPKN